MSVSTPTAPPIVMEWAHRKTGIPFADPAGTMNLDETNIPYTNTYLQASHEHSGSQPSPKTKSWIGKYTVPQRVEG